MCRPSNVSDNFSEVETNNKRQRISNSDSNSNSNSNTATVTTIVAVTVTFIGGYGLGVYETDVRVTFFVGASSLLLFTLIFNFNLNNLQQQFASCFRWMSRMSHKTSLSSMSLGRMASKGSGTALSTLSRVTSVDTIKNLSKNLLSTLDCSRSLRSAIQSITRKECFARLDYVERLSINDVSILFRYAADANLDGFEEKKFLDDQSQIVRSVITAIDMAVKVSRGSLSEGTKIPFSTTHKRSEGDVDALRFVAVTRIFAEWRNLRMVPKGYQRYAVGLSLAYRDVLQNLEKIERGVHEYLKHHQNLNEERNKNPTASIPSPTLRQLLQFELGTNVHKKLPYLKDQSSASGLLWTKRQLNYQTALLGNTLEVPEYHASPKDAASAAYRIVYTDYHGWAVKQIFSQSFGGSPPLDKIWLSICPPTDFPRSHGDNTKQNYNKTNNNNNCSPRQQQPVEYPPTVRKLSDMNSATTSHISSSESAATHEDDNDNEVLAALENFGHEIAEKWEDLLRMFNCGKEEKKKHKESLILSSESHFDLNQLNTAMIGTDISDSNSIVTSSTVSSSTTDETFVVSQRQLNLDSIKKSKRDVEDFVRDVSPMVADLGKLIDELNMNDPTKV